MLEGMLKEHRVPVLVVQQTAQRHAPGAGCGGCGGAWPGRRAVRSCQTKLPQPREAAASDPGTPCPSGLFSATSLHYWDLCRLASLGSTVFAENSAMGTGQWLSVGHLCPPGDTGQDVRVSCATGLWWVEGRDVGNILQCTGQPPTKSHLVQMSLVQIEVGKPWIR